MNSKILTLEERKKVEAIANKLLGPINGKVSISSDYMTLKRSMTSFQSGRIEWEEYCYKIKIESDKRNHEYSESFNVSNFENNESIARVGWGVAWAMFHKVDNDTKSPLAHSLWPPENGNLPDYKKISEIISSM